LSSFLSFAISGLLGGVLLCAGLIAAAPRIGWMDHPDHGRKSHQKPTALTGGLALWGVILTAYSLGWLPWHLHPIEWVGINVMAFMGALDDRFSLRPRYKAIVGLAVAMVLAGYSASLLSHTADHVEFFSLQIPTHPAWTFPLLVFWFWSIPQAYNLIDGINGLSMGFGLLILLVLGWHLGTQPVFLEGALLATFLLNFPRARHFLGDCGALMLGTLFSALSVRLMVHWDASLPLWIFAYPVTDVCLVVSIRFVNGLPLGQADRSHLHHWMMDRLDRRVWLATPILLSLAFLPMLRATDFPNSRFISLAGLFVLLGLGLKAFIDRVQPISRRTAVNVRRVRRKLSVGSQRPGPDSRAQHHLT